MPLSRPWRYYKTCEESWLWSYEKFRIWDRTGHYEEHHSRFTQRVCVDVTWCGVHTTTGGWTLDWHTVDVRTVSDRQYEDLTAEGWSFPPFVARCYKDVPPPTHPENPLHPH